MIGRYGDALGLSARLRGPMGDAPPLAPPYAFAFTVAYMVLEYGRPQDAIPGLGSLKLSLIVSGLLAFCLARYTRAVPWFRPQLVLLTLVLCMMAAWVPFATNNYWALKTFIVLLQTFLFVLSFCAFVNTQSRLRTFVLVWVASGLFQAVWGTLHGGTGTGYFQADENDFALTMCMVLPFAVMTGEAMQGWKLRGLCWITAAACLVAIVASDSRGGFVGLVVTSGMMVLMHRKRFRLMALGAVAVVALAALAPGAYWEEMKTITDTGGTRADRMKLWDIAGKVYRANPILGVGQNNINWVLNEYQEWSPDDKMHGGRAVHSLYYTLLPELGTVGALLYLGILFHNGRDLHRVIRSSRDRPHQGLDVYARAIGCSIVAFLICGVFLSVLWYPHFYLLTAMALTTRAIQERGDSPADDVSEVVPEGALESPA